VFLKLTLLEHIITNINTHKLQHILSETNVSKKISWENVVRTNVVGTNVKVTLRHNALQKVSMGIATSFSFTLEKIVRKYFRTNSEMKLKNFLATKNAFCEKFYPPQELLFFQIEFCGSFCQSCAINSLRS
jgi:hypothetical protein